MRGRHAVNRWHRVWCHYVFNLVVAPDVYLMDVMETKLESILFGVATICAATVFILISALALSAVFL